MIGERLTILLGGSDKKRQAAAIAKAQLAWTAYKQMKLKSKNKLPIRLESEWH